MAIDSRRAHRGVRVTLRVTSEQPTAILQPTTCTPRLEATQMPSMSARAKSSRELQIGSVPCSRSWATVPRRARVSYARQG
jgi:hypothetical protein